METTATIDNVPEGRQRHSARSLASPLISISLLITSIGIAVSLARGWAWIAVPLVLLSSHLMHGLLIAFHEAAHGLLRKSRRLNDIDGTIIGILSGVPFSLYRAAHQTHHAHLATERDEELWPFVRPSIPRWARCVAAFFELTVGMAYTPFLFFRTFLRAGSPIRKKQLRRRIWAELALSVIVWIGILWAVGRYDGWRYFLWVYLAPAYLAANMQSWRKYIEHVGLMGATINSSTRNIVAPGWLGRLLSFSLLEEPYHGVHHRFAGLPHAVLPQYVSVLQPARDDELPPFPSYWCALLAMIPTLGNPCVGVQWRNYVFADTPATSSVRREEA